VARARGVPRERRASVACFVGVADGLDYGFLAVEVVESEVGSLAERPGLKPLFLDASKHRPKGRCFHRAPLARGGVGEWGFDLSPVSKSRPGAPRQIFGSWNERVARNLRLRGLDTGLRAGKVLCLPPKQSLDGAPSIVGELGSEGVRLGHPPRQITPVPHSSKSA